MFKPKRTAEERKCSRQNFRLSEEFVDAAVEIIREINPDVSISRRKIRHYCLNKPAKKSGTQIYGVYRDNQVVSLMVATFLRVIPSKEFPNGKIVYISKAYTRPEYENQGFATKLCLAIEGDAYRFGADYIVCRTSAQDFFNRTMGYWVHVGCELNLWKELQ